MENSNIQNLLNKSKNTNGRFSYKKLLENIENERHYSEFWEEYYNLVYDSNYNNNYKKNEIIVYLKGEKNFEKKIKNNKTIKITYKEYIEYIDYINKLDIKELLEISKTISINKLTNYIEMQKHYKTFWNNYNNIILSNTKNNTNKINEIVTLFTNEEKVKNKNNVDKITYKKHLMKDI